MFVPESHDSFRVLGNLKKATWGLPESSWSYRNPDITQMILNEKKDKFCLIDGRRKYDTSYIDIDPAKDQTKTLKLTFGRLLGKRQWNEPQE